MRNFFYFVQSLNMKMYSKCNTLIDPEARGGRENSKRLFGHFFDIIYQIMINFELSGQMG